MIKQIIKKAIKASVYEAIGERLEWIENQNSELIYAQVWKDTMQGIEWAQDIPSISPGRWAVGYNYLYVMTRVLEELRPHKVLDIGLGISTSFFSTYFRHMNYEDGIHTVIEQDTSWRDFYLQKHPISKATHIYTSDLEIKNINGKDYYAFGDISNIVAGKKYDVISIDAPWGSDELSRRDILDYIPQCLEEEFVIIMDDTNRRGELTTLKEIENILRMMNVEFAVGTYRGTTECTVITSKKLGFLCTC